MESLDIMAVEVERVGECGDQSCGRGMREAVEDMKEVLEGMKEVLEGMKEVLEGMKEVLEDKEEAWVEQGIEEKVLDNDQQS